MAEQATTGQRVGELLQQPIVRDGEGREQRLDQYLGKGFCLVAQQANDLKLGAEANAVLQRLGGQSVALDDFALVQGEWDALFDHHRAAVVRPDRYIFGVVDDSHDLDQLVVELGRKLFARPERSEPVDRQRGRA